MGRDWAPYEHYLSEQKQIQMGYGDLFDFLENFKMEYNGKEEMCCSPEEMAIRRQFPQLGRLLMNNDFMVLHEKLSKIEGGLDLLHKRDDELAAFLKAGKVTEPEPNHSVLKVDDIGIDMDSYLMKWFAGKLDVNFYYSERNNQLFVDEMVNEANVLNLFKDIKQQLETRENTTSYGEPQAWASLENGRSIEVTLEQEGLEEKDYYYSVRLHCNEIEYENKDYNSTNGVIESFNSSGNSIDEVVKLINDALFCNGYCSVEEHSKVALDEQIESASGRVTNSQSVTNEKIKEPER